MIIKLNARNLAFALMKIINLKRFLIYIIKKGINHGIIMSLSKFLPLKIPEFGADLTSNLPIKDFWEEECKEHPSKKERLFYCD